MGKRLKKILIIITVFVVIWGAMFLTDVIRTKNDEEPVFATQIVMYEDEGSKLYTGLFYNVYHLMAISNDGDSFVNYGYHITSWFTSLSEIKERILH